MSQVLEEIPKPKDEPLIWQECISKYERSQVEYPDSKKHVGLLYDPHGNYHTITQKREIVKRFMDAGKDYTEWYAAPVWDLARELGLIEQCEVEGRQYQERYTEAWNQWKSSMNTCKPVLAPSVDKALISDTVSPISLNEAFDSVMAVHHFYRMVTALASVATIAVIVAIPLVLVWILR